MLGQIATFMESLHLTYQEVLDGIPYRTLLIMSRDKLRIATGKVMKEMSEEEELKFTQEKLNKTNKK